MTLTSLTSGLLSCPLVLFAQEPPLSSGLSLVLAWAVSLPTLYPAQSLACPYLTCPGRHPWPNSARHLQWDGATAGGPCPTNPSLPVPAVLHPESPLDMEIFNSWNFPWESYRCDEHLWKKPSGSFSVADDWLSLIHVKDWGWDWTPLSGPECQFEPRSSTSRGNFLYQDMEWVHDSFFQIQEIIKYLGSMEKCQSDSTAFLHGWTFCLSFSDRGSG